MFPVVLAGIFYHLFYPIIDWAERRNVKRGISILLLYISVIWVLVMTLSFVIPTMTKQVGELIQLIPTWWVDLKGFVDNWSGPAWTDDIMEQIQIMMNGNLGNLTSQLFQKSNSHLLVNVSSQIFPIIGTVTELAAVLIMTPFVLFYLLKDGKNFPAYILKFFPVRTRNQTQSILSEMNQQISQYIRGQIIVSFCIGGLLYIGYLIIGLPYALTLAVIAAFTSVVPYAGPMIAITPAVLVALFTSPFLLVKLIVVWIVVQLLEGKFITPNVLGKAIRVHPITILFVILCSGKIFGVLGLVFAIPGYALIKVVLTHTFNWLKDVTNLYKEESSSVSSSKDE